MNIDNFVPLNYPVVLEKIRDIVEGVPKREMYKICYDLDCSLTWLRDFIWNGCNPNFPKFVHMTNSLLFKDIIVAHNAIKNLEIPDYVIKVIRDNNTSPSELSEFVGTAVSFKKSFLKGNKCDALTFIRVCNFLNIELFISKW